VTRLGVLIATVVVLLLVCGTARGASYQVGPVSQQISPSQASAGASVGVSSSSPGASGSSYVSAEGPGEQPASVSSSPEGQESGPSRANGEACQSLPASAAPCYGVVSLPPTPEAGAPGTVAAPPVNPAVLAVGAASRMSLLAGRIEASPSSHSAGLTGAASWFWLSPTPTSQSLAVAVGAEHVTVTAVVESVQWSFGDGSSRSGGSGVPYRPGSPPSGAVRHAYQTRCLPGDRGHDPYVLSSCGSDGYPVAATVVWAISYQATGPITTTGALPARTTTDSTAYPVSEARAFLTTNRGTG
jgi:hypothetical protein